jgi:RNA polymerase sigma-70 factor, ECF subfamily
MITADARCAHDELSTRLRPFVARRVSSPDVDDVLQEVFLRLQKGIAGLHDEQRFGPWVYQVARSAIVDHHRARARHPLAEGEVELPDEPHADDENPIEGLLAQYVAASVAMLPSPYREALTLTELEGMTQKQAADMLGISLSGMKSRVQRGRQQLRALLEACCEIALDARGRVIGCEPRPDGPRPGCRCG